MDGIEMETAVDPIALFVAWMKAAEASELNDATAVALATATRDGMPSVRMVLMKRVDERGFCFYTNAESQKGVELAENPRASMLERAFPEKIPRPAYWRGYLLRPERIEFWRNGVNRMHDRFLFSRIGDGWRKERLFP